MSKSVEVILVPEAMEDLVSVYIYIYEQDRKEQAEVILHRLEERIQSLETFFLRGKLPEELTPFGNNKIREIQEFPWRIFYRPEKDEVFVLSVLDGRRAMAELLLERLVG